MEQHLTVLRDEAVEALLGNPDGVFLDGTFGRGGHSQLLLKKLSPSARQDRRGAGGERVLWGVGIRVGNECCEEKTLDQTKSRAGKMEEASVSKKLTRSVVNLSSA